MSVAFSIPDGALTQLAEQVADLVAARVGTGAQSPWLTVGEAADYLRWPKSRVQKLSASRAIPHTKHQGRLLFNRLELDAWLREFHEGPTATS